MAQIVFPALPTAGDTFIDGYGVEWIFNIYNGSNCWSLNEDFIFESPADLERYARQDGDWIILT